MFMWREIWIYLITCNSTPFSPIEMGFSPEIIVFFAENYFLSFYYFLPKFSFLCQIAKRTITKNRFVSVRSHETPRTESDKHCDQNKANVWAGAEVVIVKAKILVNSSVYLSINKRNGRHQTLLLGWVQNRLEISRKMAGITERVGEIGAESIHTFPETDERPRKVQTLVSGMFTGILYGEKR